MISVHVKTPKDKKTITIGEKSSVKDVRFFEYIFNLFAEYYVKNYFFIQFKAKISPEFENAPVEQLCLIFSGKIMKDHDTLETHNIKDGMTVHLVIRSGNAGANNQQQQSPRPNPEANPSNTPFGLGGVGGVPGMSNLGLGSGQFISNFFQFFSKYINFWSYFISSSHSWARKFYFIQS